MQQHFAPVLDRYSERKEKLFATCNIFKIVFIILSHCGIFILAFIPFCYIFSFTFLPSFANFKKSTSDPGGVLRDPSDGDVRRIFLGSKFSIPGFFWVGEFGRYFLGDLI